MPDPKKENQSFGNVLAVIHRDGGHYITEHGHKKASEDAIQIVLGLRTELAVEQEKVKGLRDDIQARRQWQSCPGCSRTFATQS